MYNFNNIFERTGQWMSFKKVRFFLVIFIFLTASSHAEGNNISRHLTAPEIERVRAVKQLLNGIDRKSLQETIEELEKARQPQINLQLKEAMANTYADIVREINVQGRHKKEWLYSMVCLNMAYLQFGGSQGTSRNATSLNRFIRQKLKKYLPPNALKQPGFFYSLE
jgi:hypothetical protein